ncbi:hypothetical protein [Vibrio mediterranei]|uniref:hypothetical protein n=1 Tax=Vibrio mediterranei TaxID=689 RepID=UPI00148B562B|nr:hypothetical protein [Vibrio mediterranei]NOI26863.1 hypothetical protein [Vibrio mediterranei]
MKFKLNAIIVGSLLVLSSSASADISHRMLIPASGTGNIMNFHYDDGTRDNYQKIGLGMQFLSLSAAPTGVRYLANQFWIVNTVDRSQYKTMYMGINPPNNAIDYDGQVHFSYFGPGVSRILSPNCHAGADGGGGVTCAIDYAVTIDNKYELESQVVSSTANTTIVRGVFTVYDPTGRNKLSETEIGKFEVNIGNGALNLDNGWIEGSADPCASTPYTQVVYEPIWFNGDKNNFRKLINVTSAKCGGTVQPLVGSNSVVVDFGS